MEQAKLKTFNCSIHEDVVINKICTSISCNNPLCCIDCVLEDDCPHLYHKKLLLIIEDYVDYAAQEFKTRERIKLSQNDPPKELLDYIIGQDERLQNLSKYIEEQKKLIEQILASMMDTFNDVCSKTKIKAFNALDEQFNNFKTNHDIYKERLNKFYGVMKHENPTKEEIFKRLNEATNTYNFSKMINEIQTDIYDRAPNDKNYLERKIEDVKFRLDRLGQKIKAQYIIEPKIQLSSQINGKLNLLEDFSKSITQVLKDSFNIINPIPRIIDSLRLDTNIINAKEEEMLYDWINPKQEIKFQLLYRASRDGFTGEAFHTKVGSYKPTVVLIESEFNKRFGGYSDLDWSVTNNYKQSNNTFLFSLDEKEKYPVKNANYAIYTHQNYGPTFGNHAIYISNQSNVNNSSYVNSFQSYDSKGKTNIHLAGAYNFKTKEIEVYQLI